MKRLLIFGLVTALLLTCAAPIQACAEGMVTIQLGEKEAAGSGSWSVTENGIRISEPGEYLISGTLEEGQIFVDCGQEGKVTLYLNGVNVHHETGPAIQIGKCSPRAVISLVEGSRNSLSNGKNLIFEEEDEPDGVIFSRSDLTVEGSGQLEILAGAMNGIVSKDDLKIRGGEVVIEAPNHGIKGKDCVEISGGSIRIQAGKDGIKSTNKNDPDRGYIDMTGGEVTIECGDDALSFITGCTVTGGSLRITMLK